MNTAPSKPPKKPAPSTAARASVSNHERRPTGAPFFVGGYFPLPPVTSSGCRGRPAGITSSPAAKLPEIGKFVDDAMVAMPTQIPVCLWFLKRDKSKPGHTLFIDARKMGTLIDRVHRELTSDDISKIADTLPRVAGCSRGR